MVNLKLNSLQVFTHIAALIPAGLLVWDNTHNNLTFNPIQEATFRTGKTALILLILSLSVTPIYLIFKFKQVIPLRRPLGLYAFGYAALHGYIFIGLDYGFNWDYIKEAVFLKRYALVGFTTFLTLLPLAITSTKSWQRKLKKHWKQLHRLAYLSGILAIVHYVWLVKSDIREPLIYGAVLLIVLAIRLPFVRKSLSKLNLVRWLN